MATKKKTVGSPPLKIGDKVLIEGVVKELGVKVGPHTMTYVTLDKDVTMAVHEKHIRKV